MFRVFRVKKWNAGTLASLPVQRLNRREIKVILLILLNSSDLRLMTKRQFMVDTTPGLRGHEWEGYCPDG